MKKCSSPATTSTTSRPCELFYNVHIAPWCQLTGDLQIIRPVRPAADTAIVPGVRVRLVF